MRYLPGGIMSKHHKYRRYESSYVAAPRDGIALEVLAHAEKAGAKAGYATAKEHLYRNIGAGAALGQGEIDELLAAAERAGAAAALASARKVLAKTLRTSFSPAPMQAPIETQQTPMPIDQPVQPASYAQTYEEPLARYNPPIGYVPMPKVKTDQHVLTVTRVQRLSEQMVRIIASAPNLGGYRSNGALDEYVKVFVADPALGLAPPYDLRALRQRLPRELMPRSKSYTIRWVDTLTDELAIDFVVHGEPGTVGHWAGTVEPGAALVISPARSKSSFKLIADDYILAADEAGIPAISKILEALPEHARGIALLEIADQQAMFDVKHPENVDLRWVARDGVPAGRSNVLLSAFQTLQAPATNTTVVAHAERSTIKAIGHVCDEWRIHKGQRHISSYWTLREDRLLR